MKILKLNQFVYSLLALALFAQIEAYGGSPEPTKAKYSPSPAQDLHSGSPGPKWPKEAPSAPQPKSPQTLRPDLNPVAKPIEIKTEKARKGGGGTGGGDIGCDERIEVIRADLKTWIVQGGHKDLKLPEDWTHEKYATEMLKQIETAKFKCVSKGDPEYPVKVGTKPKICRFDKEPQPGFICDFSKFLELGQTLAGQSKQYVQIHHEYAGLAAVELPDSEDEEKSYFPVSRQISGYLVDEVIRKLAVKPRKPIYEPFKCDKPKPIKGIRYEGDKLIAVDLKDILITTSSFGPNHCLDTDFPKGQVKSHLERGPGSFACMHYGMGDEETDEKTVSLFQEIQCRGSYAYFTQNGESRTTAEESLLCSVIIRSFGGNNELYLNISGGPEFAKLTERLTAPSSETDKLNFAMQCYRSMVRSLSYYGEDKRSILSGRLK